MSCTFLFFWGTFQVFTSYNIYCSITKKWRRLQEPQKSQIICSLLFLSRVLLWPITRFCMADQYMVFPHHLRAKSCLTQILAICSLFWLFFPVQWQEGRCTELLQWRSRGCCSIKFPLDPPFRCPSSDLCCFTSSQWHRWQDRANRKHLITKWQFILQFLQHSC